MVKVIKWGADEEFYGKPESISCLGGFFSEGMRWTDYISEFDEKYHPYLEAVRESVIENRKLTTGECHQDDEEGVPMFDDGTIVALSWRAFGDLMAAIWSTELDMDLEYMDFYMVCTRPTGEILAKMKTKYLT